MKTMLQNLQWVLVSVVVWNLAGVADAEETERFGGVQFSRDTDEMGVGFCVQELYEVPGSEFKGVRIVETQFLPLSKEIQEVLIGPWSDMTCLDWAARDVTTTAQVLRFDEPGRQKIADVVKEMNQRFESYAWQLKKETLSKRDSRIIAGELATFLKDSYLQLTDESQREKLKNIAVILEIRGFGMVDGLTKGIMRERLNVSEKQSEEMRKLLPDVDHEFRAEILKLARQYREQLLKEELTEAQLEKLNQLRGKLIEDSKLTNAQYLEGLEGFFDFVK